MNNHLWFFALSWGSRVGEQSIFAPLMEDHTTEALPLERLVKSLGLYTGFGLLA